MSSSTTFSFTADGERPRRRAVRGIKAAPPRAVALRAHRARAAAVGLPLGHERAVVLAPVVRLEQLLLLGRLVRKVLQLLRLLRIEPLLLALALLLLRQRRLVTRLRLRRHNFVVLLHRPPAHREILCYIVVGIVCARAAGLPYKSSRIKRFVHYIIIKYYNILLLE